MASALADWPETALVSEYSEAAERLLECFPAGVAVAAVATSRVRGPLRDVDARRGERRRGEPAGHPFGARVNQPGFGGKHVSHQP